MWAAARVVYCFRSRMSRTSLIVSQTAHTQTSPKTALCTTSPHSILSLLPQWMSETFRSELSVPACRSNAAHLPSVGVGPASSMGGEAADELIR